MHSRRDALKGMAAALPAVAGILPAAALAAVSLKDAYKGAFRVGAAINPAQITGRDVRGDAIVTAQFDSVTPDNCLKWESVHPEPERYDFALPDQFVAFGERNGMYTVGHCLLWHSQVPDWVFRDARNNLLGRDALLKRLQDHIRTVAGRYKGRIKAWDVVNEVIGDDGGMRNTLWLQIIGEDYIAKAFQFAREADPDAELIYNDYNIEYPGKRAGALALVEKLKAAGVPITTVGIQAHYLINEPDLGLLDDTIAEFARLGVKVALTELDIDVLPRPGAGVTADVSLRLASDPKYNPYVDGLPDAVQKELAARYAGVFAIALKHRETVDRVTTWGVTDADSWHNNWPIRGRTAYSLLFDRAGRPKPAYYAVLKAATG